MDSIEAILASPPERDEVVVQFFVKNGGQWGEIFREIGSYKIELYLNGSLKLDALEMMQSIDVALKKLKERLE